MADKKEMEYLVLDAGGIIKGNALELFTKAKSVVTVPEVFAEIRDSKARAILDRLPYEVTEMNPSPASVKAVFDFARKTGDFAALSKTDLKLIALTYQLSGKVEAAAPSAEAINIRRNDETQGAGGGGGGGKSGGGGGGVTPVAPVPKAPSHAWKVVPKEGASPWAKIASSAATDTDSTAAYVVPEPASVSIADAAAALDDSRAEDEDDAAALLQAEDAFPPLMGSKEGPSGDASSVVPNSQRALHELSHLLKKTTVDETYTDNLQAKDRRIDNNNNNMSNNDDDDDIHDNEDVEQDSELLDSFPVLKKQQQHLQPQEEEKKPISTSSSIMRASGFAGSMKEDQDDGSGWINTDNMKSHLSISGCTLGIATTETSDGIVGGTGAGTSKSARARGRKRAAAAASASKADENPKAACVTADFSMQNVLMQMGLSIYSIDGLLIKSIKQWVLRCMACFQIHYQMDRVFCSKCGANHMSRVACSIDSKTGELHLHLKANYRRDLRGTKYNLPLPGQQGKYEGELLLREDQLLSGAWRQKVVMIKKDVKSIFGEQVTNDVGLHINKSQGIKLGLGSRNPNAAKGRERRGKAKRK